MVWLLYRRKIPTPILPEFKPPQSSDFEPTLSAHLQPTRTRGDSDPPEPSHTKYFTEDTTTKSRASHETKDTNMDDMEECDLEESHVMCTTVEMYTSVGCSPDTALLFSMLCMLLLSCKYGVVVVFYVVYFIVV